MKPNKYFNKKIKEIKMNKNNFHLILNRLSKLKVNKKIKKNKKILDDILSINSEIEPNI
jgi:hypothetical protein